MISISLLRVIHITFLWVVIVHVLITAMISRVGWCAVALWAKMLTSRLIHRCSGRLAVIH